jgi:hypothetical protein
MLVPLWLVVSAELRNLFRNLNPLLGKSPIYLYLRACYPPVLPYPLLNASPNLCPNLLFKPGKECLLSGVVPHLLYDKSLYFHCYQPGTLFILFTNLYSIYHQLILPGESLYIFFLHNTLDITGSQAWTYLFERKEARSGRLDQLYYLPFVNPL